MLVPVVLILVTLLILPGLFIASLWTAAERTRVGWMLRAVSTGALVLWLFVAGRWDWVSYYLRFVVLILFVAAAVVSYRRTVRHGGPHRSGRVRWASQGGSLLTTSIFIGLLVWSARGYLYTDAPVQLAFPLADGWFYVGQGGDSSLINYHNPNRAQRYALDIVELYASGARARGIYPTELARYAIFGATVHSPCDGRVSAAIDGLPNQIPPASDPTNPAGNHLVVRCKGVEVLLAHFDTGSIIVHRGDVVRSGQPLGRVGNSGNTSEPHLHIHAVRAGQGNVLTGQGVPMLFNGRFAVRNMTF